MSVKRDLIRFLKEINKETSEITAAIIVCVRYQSGKRIIDVYKFQDPTKDFIDIYIDQLDLACRFVYGTIWFCDNTWAERVYDYENDMDWWEHRKLPKFDEELIALLEQANQC